MIQFNLRSMFTFVLAISVLLALSLRFPVLVSVVAVFAGAAITRLYARRKLLGPAWLWFYASCGGTVAMLSCVFVASLQVNPDGTQIAWSRAFPASLFVGVLVGTIVSLVDRPNFLREIPCEMRFFDKSGGRVRSLR